MSDPIPASICVLSIEAFDEVADSYIATVQVSRGSRIAEGKAIVVYSADRARWVKLDGHTPYWLSAELVAACFRIGRDPLVIANAIEDAAARAADKRDAEDGCRLLQATLEAASYAEVQRLEELRDAEIDRRIKQAKEDRHGQ